MSEQRKTATLVLGADSDMGVEIIRGLAGTVIAHCYAAPELLEPLCVGDRELISISGDLSDLDGIGALISQIEQLDFDISKLVHLPSAPARLERFREFDARRFERDFNISFMSAALACRAFVPAMAKRRFGRVVFMLSSYTIGPPPKFLASYVACKSALGGLVRSLAVEYAEKGVCINAVAPSMADTKFLSTLADFTIGQNARSNPTGRLATPADIAPAVLHLIRDDNEYTTGAVIPITGGSAF